MNPQKSPYLERHSSRSAASYCVPAVRDATQVSAHER